MVFGVIAYKIWRNVTRPLIYVSKWRDVTTRNKQPAKLGQKHRTKYIIKIQIAYCRVDLTSPDFAKLSTT